MEQLQCIVHGRDKVILSEIKLTAASATLRCQEEGNAEDSFQHGSVISPNFKVYTQVRNNTGKPIYFLQ
jgi:hypothetical protein